MSKQLANETDDQYEQRMAKELDEFMAERGLSLVASVVTIPITSPDGQHTFFAQRPDLQLRKKKSNILHPSFGNNGKHISPAEQKVIDDLRRGSIQ